MRFDLDNLNPPAWFDHPEHEGARILLRVLPTAELEKIQKKTVKLKVEYRRGVRHEFEKVNEEKKSALTWDYCIVDWQGILDASGNEIECTTENKILLFRNAPNFTAWVVDCIDQLNDDSESRVELAEKN